jgi:hypothetical protein
MSTTGWVLLLILGVYFLPTIVAGRHPNSSAIFVLNLLLGWTFVGWVIALVWACTKPSHLGGSQLRELDSSSIVDDKALRQNINHAQAVGPQRGISRSGWAVLAIIIVGSFFLGAWYHSPEVPTTSPTIQTAGASAPIAQATSTKSVAPVASAAPATDRKSDEVKNSANDWLLAQPDAARAAMLGKVVGDKCKGKTAFYQGTIKSDSHASADPRPKLPILPGAENDTFWSIMCYDGRSFEVEVHPDGSGQVLECAVLKTMHAGECFKKF